MGRTHWARFSQNFRYPRIFYQEGAPLPFAFLFQLAEGGASPPQNPFYDFLKHFGISTTPPRYFPPSPPRSPQTISSSVRDKILSDIKKGKLLRPLDMESSSSESPENIGNSPSHEASSPQHAIERPADYDSTFEDWLGTPKGAPSQTSKGKERVVEDES